MGGHRSHHCYIRRVVCLDPVAKGIPQIHQRVPNGCHFPVKDSGDAGGDFFVQDTIVQLMVVVNNAWSAGIRGHVPEPFTIASWISNYVSEERYDLILCGVMAEDHMHGQVGSMLAELLDLPCATSVISERIDLERGIIYVEREIEGGQRAELEMDLPAVLTFQTCANEPRYPTLSNLMRAKKQGALVIPLDILPAVRDREKIVGVDYPQKMRSGLFLEGNMEQKAALLLDILEKEALIS